MKRLLSFSRIIVILTVGLGAAGAVSAQEFITNGSLTGPIANANVPPGWTILAPSPDTIDENNNVGTTGIPFGAAPSGPSPDDGTWIGFAALDDFREIFGQTVTGLTVGEQYEVSWYAGNFGAVTGPGYVGANAIQVFVDGSPIGSGGVLPLASNWVTESLTFSATATSHELSFGLLNVDASYLSIDGISLTTAGPPVPPVAAVPVPALSQWALIMLSMLLGLMVLANRKRLF